ncbi:hypothetical protein [Streptomyces sp. 7N604]|uniref:hypothetical protein n=1 Tax=Streptomyces sp. 7N604 TaxID=3457415 RepID=UPI003FCFF744
MRDDLTRAIEQRDTARFVPRPVDGGPLPGTRLHSAVDLRFLTLPSARSAAQYVYNGANNRLVTVRELVAGHDPDRAHTIPDAINLGAMLDVLVTIIAEHRRPEVSYHRPSGRLYARTTSGSRST